MSINKDFDAAFLKLIKTYIVVFVLTFVCYTFINWFLTTKARVLEINEAYTDYWIPLVVSAVLTYLIFRPLVKQNKFKEKAADISLWFLIPFSIGFPVSFSQPYFKDTSYSAISIDKPTDILKFPNERFFRIKNFVVVPERYFIIRERHTTGRYGTNLEVSNYYTAPIYDDTLQTYAYSKVAYGVRFSTSMHNGIFTKDEQPALIEKFNSQSEIDYHNYSFNKADLFERVSNSDEATHYHESWNRNSISDKSVNPFVVVKMDRTLSELYAHDLNNVIYSTIICFSVTIILLLLFNRYKFLRPDENLG